MFTREDVAQLNQRFVDSSPEEILAWAVETVPAERIALASSMGLEDQLLTARLVALDRQIHVFTLDTGRLFPETYELIQKSNGHFGIRIDVRFPEASDVEEMVRVGGPNLFYDSVENRRRCCHVRKVRSLRKVLAGLDAWITGLRRDQAVTRTELLPFSWDDDASNLKISPLWRTTEDEVRRSVRVESIPYNRLHDEGFPSIGCAPCTRAVEPGADPRSGRWWWERDDHRECGIHTRRRG